MGYYTCYDLGVPQPTKDCQLTDEQIAEKLVEAFASLSYFECDSDRLRELWGSRKQNIQALNDWDWLVEAAGVVNEVLFLSDSIKWYDYDTDMADISTDIPNVYFTLDGDGEGNDDLWRSYFLNGIEHRFNSVIPDQELAAKVARERRATVPVSGRGGF